MPIPTPRLRVLANPWLYIDHLGRPAGRLPFDFYEHTQAKGFVGAAFADATLVKPASVMRVANMDLEVRAAEYDRKVVYSRQPVELPNTAYYREAVRKGDLFAADSMTASTCGLPSFTEPAKLLDQAKSEAVKHFDASTGTDAYRSFGASEPLYDTPAASPQKSSDSTAKKGDSQ